MSDPVSITINQRSPMFPGLETGVAKAIIFADEAARRAGQG
jgi:hypothetical protein